MNWGINVDNHRPIDSYDIFFFSICIIYDIKG